jgi:hypothetical protein
LSKVFSNVDDTYLLLKSRCESTTKARNGKDIRFTFGLGELVRQTDGVLHWRNYLYHDM